ncbi:MAG TPA: glutaredoxin domain-containing protein [Vicinamibacterales bacterium]|nr:glutaredoxin domain-containing protein [Vicinamibacterales bacterium]
MRQVTLYTAAGCARSEDVREVLRRLGVAFTEIDVGADPLALHRAILFSGESVLPAVDVDGEVVVGFDRERLEELLAATGE